MNSATMQSSAFVSRLSQYLLAFLLIAGITALFLLLRDALDTTLVALLYLVPLGMITARWGLATGITSALITNCCKAPVFRSVWLSSIECT